MPIRNIGIFAHVDAGKTTLSEQILLCAGTIKQAGSVDRGTAHTDDLPVERRRGISVRAASVSLTWRGVDIQLIDTPGHTDFSAEIERAFWALDGAILLVDAAQGVQPQTETLFRALRAQGLPVLFFVNKMDRPEANAARVCRQIRRRLTPNLVPMWDAEEALEFVCGTDEELMERYLRGETIPTDERDQRLAALTARGEACPALSGSALRGQGICELLDAVLKYLPAPPRGEKRLCAVAFAAGQDRVMGRGLWVRLFGGRLENRMPIELQTGTDRVTGEPITVQRKITQIRDGAGRDLGALEAGMVGVVYGLGDVEIGHVFGDAALLPRKVQPGLLRTPLITASVAAEDPAQRETLREACQTLSLEDPLLHAQVIRDTGEIQIQAMGRIQLEILQETLETRFGVRAAFGEPRVIYRETIRQKATGFVAYTMPKPCWAILRFELSPAPRGSGVTYRSTVPVRDIMLRYQHQVEQTIPQALSQGRLGWQVTDVEITLVGGEHHLVHTHPLDFIVATPMAIQDGLRQGGSVLLEPILEVRLVVPLECVGRVMTDVQQMRGEVTDTVSDEDTAEMTALVPVATSLNYPTEFAAVTRGKGSMSTALHGYRECPLELGRTAARRGVDPLDKAKYILAARSALEGGIFD